jgi:hypothetical protein
VYIKREIANAYLNESVTLFVINLNSNNRITRRTRPNTHLNHLFVEEASEILFVRLVGNTAYIKPARLSSQVRIGAAYTKGGGLGE